PIHEVIPEVPEWLCRIVAKLHAKNPADRYQTAKEVADVLADREAQLKAHGMLKAYGRIPGGKRSAGIGRWIRFATLTLLLPLMAWGVYALTRPVGHADGGSGSAQRDTPSSEGWTQLFNGKDLTGWKTHPKDPGNWRVEDGAIVGQGNHSFL